MDEVNVPRTFSDAGWPPQPAPERPGPDTAGGVRTQRLGTKARVALGLTAAIVLAGVSVLGATLSGSAAGTAHAAGAVLTGSASSAGGSPHGTGHGDGAAWGAFGHGDSSGDQPWAMSHGARARLHACIESARRLRASGPNDAARIKLHACFHRFIRHRAAMFGRMHAREARLRLLHRSMHGQVTIDSKNGPETIAFERGTVQSVSGNSVAIKAADGVTWTWQVGSDTRVYRDWRKVGAGTLAGGQQVAVMGLVTGGTNQARGVLVLDHTRSHS